MQLQLDINQIIESSGGERLKAFMDRVEAFKKKVNLLQPTPNTAVKGNLTLCLREMIKGKSEYETLRLTKFMCLNMRQNTSGAKKRRKMRKGRNGALASYLTWRSAARNPYSFRRPCISTHV